MVNSMDKEDIERICLALSHVMTALYDIKDNDDNSFEESMHNINAIITGLENKYDLY